jgi:hypothetical protein
MRITFAAGDQAANISPKIQTSQCTQTFVNSRALITSTTLKLITDCL